MWLMREMTFNVPPINLLKNSVKLLLHMCFREGRNEMVLVASNFYDSSLASYIISEAQQVTDDENHFLAPTRSHNVYLSEGLSDLKQQSVYSDKWVSTHLSVSHSVWSSYCRSLKHLVLLLIFQNPCVAKVCVFMWTLICISTLIFPSCPIRIVKTVLKHPNVLQYPSSQTLVRFIQSENDNNHSLLPEWGHDLGWN